METEPKSPDRDAESDDDPDASPVSEREQPMLAREGVLLALATAVAYWLAYSFEVGHARRFGYPYWMIDIDIVALIAAWGAVVVTTVMASVPLHWMMSMMPARWARAFLFNRHANAVTSTIIALLVGRYLIGIEPWAGLLMYATAAIGLFITLGTWRFYYRLSDDAKSLLERFEEAAEGIRDFQTRHASEKPDSVLDRALRSAFFRFVAGWIFFAVAISALVYLPVATLAERIAGVQTTFMVSQDTPTVVVVSQYDDFIIAAPLRRDERLIVREFRLLPLVDPSQSWASENLGRLDVVPLCIDSVNTGGCVPPL